MKLQQLISGNKKNDRTPLKWDLDTEAAFEKCKIELAIYVDVSDVAVGAALHQKLDGCLQPLGFYSRKLTDTQRKYSTYDQAVCHFRYMIGGRRCYLVTDHRALIFAFQQKVEKASPRRIRQLDFIGQFTTDIRYTPGITNVTADALSQVESIDQRLEYTRIAAAQQSDEELRQMLENPGTEKNSLHLKPFPIPGCDAELMCNTTTSHIRPFIPREFRQQALATVHGLSHPGVRATTKMTTTRFCWPGI